MSTFSATKERRLIPLSDLEENPYQFRGVYDPSKVNDLASSIQELGLLQIPVARQAGHKHQLAFGHCRWKAFAQLARSGLLQYGKMPVDVMDLTDQQMFEIAISENLKRADLSPIEKAAALKQYMEDFHATSIQAAKLFGVSESTIRGTVRLLNLPDEIKEKVRSGQVSQHQARKFLEQPATEQKRAERAQKHFDLREQLILLLYGEARSDVTDQLLFKKLKALVETNRQLERQIELTNGRRHQQDRIGTVRAATAT
jgi:ParB family transcriptional regulator, chromosome partitioning protein